MEIKSSSSSSSTGESHQASEKRMKSFSRTPKERLERAFCTRRGNGGMNLMSSRFRQPRGIVTTTESAWKVSCLDEVRVIGLFCVGSTLIEHIFVLSLTTLCDNAG